MWILQSAAKGLGSERKKTILILCAHLHEDRARKKDKDDLQPMVGVHVYSLLDQGKYDITLHHEMWHGPYDTRRVERFDIVILSGLQMDFDRMRQLSYFFRRSGALVLAGGSICTLFPEFAKQFFDVVCAGGVECITDFVKDYENDDVKSLYVSPQNKIRYYELDHSILWQSGISLPIHHIESSRGCNFTCDFCSIPAERAKHAIYTLQAVAKNIDDSIDGSPRLSLRRLHPFIWFIDNNFSNNIAHVREVCALMKNHKRVKSWGALITQDVLRNRKVIQMMADAKCRRVFAGIESFDTEFIAKHNKRQNKTTGSELFDDIAYAESLGVMVMYGYLFDPRFMTVREMERQMRFILQSDVLNFPHFVAFVAPLVGTKLFWQCIGANELQANLRLRDLDGRCIAYRSCLDDEQVLAEFALSIFGKPYVYMDLKKLSLDLLKIFAKYILNGPWIFILYFVNRERMFRLGRKHSKSVRRNYIGGKDILDPQYSDIPTDIAPEDKKKYFDPILVTDENGDAADWLEPYRPAIAVAGRTART